MTPRQRTATWQMCAAILGCAACPPDLAFRARNLQACVELDAAWDRIFGR